MKRIASLMLCAALMAAPLFAPAAAQEHDPERILEELPSPRTDADERASGGQSYADLASGYYEAAVKLHMAGDLERAVQQYRQAILMNPDIAAYHADLGEAYRLLGRTRQAIESMQRAIEIDPQLANAFTTLGVIYDSQELLVNAVEYHRKAIAIDPGHFIAYNNLGHSYDRLGLIRAAMACYEKAIELNPDFAPAYDNLGTNHLNLGDIETGIKMIQKALNLSSMNDPQRPLYLNDLGAAYVMKKEYKVAAGYFEQAARLAPYNPDIMRNYQFIKEYLNER